MKKILAFLPLVLLNLVPLPAQAITKINVPFILQAPEHRWIQPWADACEEASILMVKYFYFVQNRVSTKEASQKITQLVKTENDHFGFNKDTDASQTAELINLYLPYEATLKDDPTIEEIKNEIDQGNPVIVPLHGKDLQNKYFRNGGPDYHMAVISGYNEETQEFVTQDPGIGRGHDFRYSYSTLMGALHDFLPNGQTEKGNKVAIFTTTNLTWSAETDGDKDGLNKRDELSYGTDLMDADTDHDGFADGLEVQNGYSPLVAELLLSNGTIVKTKDDSKIYLLQNQHKKYIANLTALTKYGRGKKVITVSDNFLNNLPEGDNLN